MLETPRLRLRRWQPSDEAPFAAMNADPESMQYFPAPITREQACLAIALFEQNFDRLGYGFWAVEMKDGGAFVGSIGLEPTQIPMLLAPEPLASVAIGWQVARAHWGQGYAHEAAKAVLEDATARLGLPEVVALMAPANQASIGVCERLGMVRDTSMRVPDPLWPSDHPFHAQILYRAALRS